MELNNLPNTKSFLQALMQEPEVRGVAIVYGRDGTPRLDKSFLQSLDADALAKVEFDIGVRGFKLVNFEVVGSA